MSVRYSTPHVHYPQLNSSRVCLPTNFQKFKCHIFICVWVCVSIFFLLFFSYQSISFCFRWFRFAFVGFVLVRFHFVDFVSFRFVFVDFVSFRFVFVDFVSFRFVSFLFRFALYRYPLDLRWFTWRSSNFTSCIDSK
jgi:hypothetical protein